MHLLEPSIAAPPLAGHWGSLIIARSTTPEDVVRYDLKGRPAAKLLNAHRPVRKGPSCCLSLLQLDSWKSELDRAAQRF